MVKQPTYVWIVEDNDMEENCPAGVMGVYASRQEAVKRVREFRRAACHEAGVDGFGDEYGAIRLKDWKVTDEPHEFAFDLDHLDHEPHQIRAYRIEVQR